MSNNNDNEDKNEGFSAKSFLTSTGDRTGIMDIKKALEDGEALSSGKRVVQSTSVLSV